MFQSFICWKTILWIKWKHFWKQIFNLEIEMFQALKSFGDVFWVFTHHFKFLETFRFEKLLASKEVEKHATCAENVTFFIKFLLINDFWSHVPNGSSHHIFFFRIYLILFNRNTIITKKDWGILRTFANYILRFNISMDDPNMMEYA